MELQDLKRKLNEICPSLETKIRENVSMASYCSFKAGGNAALFAEPSTVEELRTILRVVTENDVPHLILGNGTNTLFEDGVYEGVVIRPDNASSEFGGIDICVSPEEEDVVLIRAGAGALLARVAKMSAAEPWSAAGMEGLTGIPGSIGGAVFMNAGAYGYETGKVLKSVHAVSPDGRDERDFTKDEVMPGYRHSAFMENGYIVTSAEFSLFRDKQEDIQDRISDFTKARTEKQPLNFASAGSTFKRPEGYFAGKLIEDAGLKGTSVGPAMVSTLHAGFIVNTGGATATDILSLIEYVQQKVFETSGVTLEPEVRIIRSGK